MALRPQTAHVAGLRLSCPPDWGCKICIWKIVFLFFCKTLCILLSLHKGRQLPVSSSQLQPQQEAPLHPRQLRQVGQLGVSNLSGPLATNRPSMADSHEMTQCFFNELKIRRLTEPQFSSSAPSCNQPTGESKTAGLCSSQSSLSLTLRYYNIWAITSGCSAVLKQAVLKYYFSKAICLHLLTKLLVWSLGTEPDKDLYDNTY